MRLTTHFGAYKLAKYEKATGKSVMDLLDVGNFEVNKIVNLIALGNDYKTEEEAYKKLDEYLADENNSLISAYFDLLKEMDENLKILKSCGIKVEDLKKEFASMSDKMGEDFKEKLKETASETDKG